MKIIKNKMRETYKTMRIYINILYNINDENVLKVDILIRSRINISFIVFNKFFFEITSFYECYCLDR